MKKTALILTLFTFFRINASEFYPEQSDFLDVSPTNTLMKKEDHNLTTEAEDDEMIDFNSSFLVETFNARLQLYNRTHPTPKTIDDSEPDWSRDASPVCDDAITCISYANIKGSFESALQHLKNKEYEKAFPLLNTYACLNIAEAQWELGLCYLDGKGIDANHEKAMQYFQMAADQGHVLAQEALDTPLNTHNALNLDIIAQPEEMV